MTCPICGSNLEQEKKFNCTKKNATYEVNNTLVIVGCDLSATKDFTAEVQFICKQNCKHFMYCKIMEEKQ